MPGCSSLISTSKRLSSDFLDFTKIGTSF